MKTKEKVKAAVKTVETKVVKTPPVEKKKAEVKAEEKHVAVKAEEPVVKVEEPKVEKPVVESKEPVTFVEKMIFGFTPKEVPNNRLLHIKGEQKLEVIDGRVFNRGVLKEGWIVRLSSGKYRVTKVDDSGANLEGNTSSISARSEVEIIDPNSKEARIINTEVVSEESISKEPAKQEVKTKEVKAGQYNFNGKTLSKSFLAREIVAKYVQDNPKADIKELEAKFPIPGMGKYGLFKEVSEAKKISGAGLPRYFFKPEQLIKVGKSEVAVCNQITEERINSIIEAAKAVGYTIE